MKKKYNIFISYRRNGGSDKAELLKNVFTAKGYPADSIFMDTHTLESGDFRKRISQAISESINFVVLITKDCWTFNGPEDFFVFEIKTAIESGINIVPVFFDGITSFDPLSIPGEIASLQYKNAVPYSHIYADASFNKLCSFLKSNNADSDVVDIQNTNSDIIDFDYDDALDALAVNNLRDAVKALIVSISTSGNAQSVKVLNKVLWQNYGAIHWDDDDWEFFERESNAGHSVGDIALFFRYFNTKSTHDKAYSYVKKATTDRENGYAFMCEGVCRLFGIGVPVNLQSAYRRFEYARKLQIPESFSYVAETYLNGNMNQAVDVERAVEILKDGSNAGDSRSVFLLGTIYATENYGLFDEEKAKKYFTSATEMQNNQAWMELGKIYGRLFRDDANFDKAMHCYNEAISNGLVEGIACKALLLWKRDCYEDAVREVQKGVKLNSPASLSMLGNFYEQGIPDVDKWIIEHKPDFPHAWQCYKTAFDLSGNINDAISMARLYVREDYRPEDVTWELIEKYLLEAVKIPRIEAIDLMIEALKKNGKAEEAHVYLKIGADAGSLDMKYRYASLMYTIDQGVALKNMKEAANMGHKKAIEKMVDWSKDLISQEEYGHWMNVAIKNQIEVDFSDYSKYLCKNNRVDELKEFVASRNLDEDVHALYYMAYYAWKGVISLSDEERSRLVQLLIRREEYLVANHSDSLEIIIDIISSVFDEQDKQKYIQLLSEKVSNLYRILDILELINQCRSEQSIISEIQKEIKKAVYNEAETKLIIKKLDPVIDILPDEYLQAYEKKVSVLIVDDVRVNLTLTSMILKNVKKYDLDVHTVTDGESALATLNKLSGVSIVALDLMMPGMDGFKLLKKIRQKYHSNTVRVIAVSALNGDDNIQTTLNLGANGFICKPIQPLDFVKTFERHAKSLIFFDLASNEICAQLHPNQ